MGRITALAGALLAMGDADNEAEAVRLAGLYRQHDGKALAEFYAKRLVRDNGHKVAAEQKRARKRAKRLRDMGMQE